MLSSLFLEPFLIIVAAVALAVIVAIAATRGRHAVDAGGEAQLGLELHHRLARGFVLFFLWMFHFVSVFNINEP